MAICLLQSIFPCVGQGFRIGSTWCHTMPVCMPAQSHNNPNGQTHSSSLIAASAQPFFLTLLTPSPLSPLSSSSPSGASTSSSALSLGNQRKSNVRSPPGKITQRVPCPHMWLASMCVVLSTSQRRHPGLYRATSPESMMRTRKRTKRGRRTGLGLDDMQTRRQHLRVSEHVPAQQSLARSGSLLISRFLFFPPPGYLISRPVESLPRYAPSKLG